MSFRFVHIGDIHLDTPFKSRDPHLREMLDTYLKKAFIAAVNLTIDRDAHALLIAGDLFDDDTLSYSTVKFLSSEIDRLREADIPVFYATGNHDPSIGLGRSSAIKWADNVHVFSSAKPELVPIVDSHGDTLACIVGAGHERRREDRNLAREFPRAASGSPYIGLLHTWMLDGDSSDAHDRYAPCSRKDLEEKGYAYWALGHIHKRVEYTDSTYIVYPGNISGRSFRETGAKGAYYVEITGESSVKAQFIPLSRALWLDFDIEIFEDIGDWMDLEDHIRERLTDKLNVQLSLVEDMEMVLVRANLKGRSSMYHFLRNEEDMDMLGNTIGEDLGIDYISLDTGSVYPALEVESYRQGAHLASYVLDLIGNLGEDHELLLSLSPEPLAKKLGQGQGGEKTLEYLKDLLDGMEYEALTRLIEEGEL